MTQRSRRPLTLIVPAVVSLALGAGMVSAVAQDDAPVVSAPLNTVQAEQPARGLIVKLEDATDTRVSDLVDDVADELPDDVTVADTEAGAEDLGLLSLSDQVDAKDLDEAIEQLEANPAVEWAIPNGVRMPSASASDTYYGNLWNLHGTYGVRANSAWDVSLGNPNVRVAVIDTGILANHPDLTGQLVAGRDFVDDEYYCGNRSCSSRKYMRSYVSAGDGNSWDTNPADPGDFRVQGMCPGMSPNASTWHGTHVAGIVAAKRNNGGVVGVAPGVKVQPIRALGRCGGTDWDIAMSILWASGANVNSYDKRHGKIPLNRTPSKVINLSLGGLAKSVGEAQQVCKLYRKVGSVARARGTTLVAAAGNSGIDHRYNVPSSCPGFIAVAATSKAGTPAYYSNRGAGIDIAAPGGSGVGTASDQVLSTYNTGTTTPGTNTYGWLPGTSMAAPAVAGAAALAYSVGITNPTIVERVLKATARPAPGCTAATCGAGLVDANAVLRAKAPKTAPRVVGKRSPGHLMRASTGTWRNATQVQVVWYRGSKAVSRSSAYRATKADLGRTLRVRSRAVGGNPKIFHETLVKVKGKSRVTFAMPKKVKKSKKVKVRVKVAAQYGRPTGVIKVYDRKKRIATKRIYAKNKGKVTITLPKLKKKGKHSIRVYYSGNGKTWGSKRGKVVRAR